MAETDKHVLILGGTGSLGQALVKNFIRLQPHVKSLSPQEVSISIQRS